MPFKKMPWRKPAPPNKSEKPGDGKPEQKPVDNGPASGSIESLNNQLTKADLLKQIPSFQETSPQHKPELFIHKLKLCQILFDWDEDSLTDSREKDAKRQQLLELVEFIGKNKNIYTEQALTEITRMVSVNLFRPLPPKVHQYSMPEPDDDPVFDQAWPHLQIVYEFFLRFIVSSDVEVKVLKKYIKAPFVIKILELFDSEDHRERDYLKTILHRIYAKFMLLRSFIRKSISHVFFVFVWETERYNGIAELLEILGSIINGFALPLKEEHVKFLKRVLIPMHKVKPLGGFHQQLSYCVTQFVDKDPILSVPVINGLLKFWPMLSSSKAVMFLNELEELLELTQPEEFKIVLPGLFKVLSRAFGSSHFQVAERALFYWHNEYISGLIADHRAEILPIIYPVLRLNSEDHWNQTVNDLTLNVLRIFLELDQTLVEKCSNIYTESLSQKAEKEKVRREAWDGLEKASKKYKLDDKKTCID